MADRGRVHIAQDAATLRAQTAGGVRRADDAPNGPSAAATEHAAGVTRAVLSKDRMQEVLRQREEARKQQEMERELVGDMLRLERARERDAREDWEDRLARVKKPPREPQKGDWECPACGWDNYARNKVCYRRECEEPRPLTKSQRKRRREKEEEEQRQEDRKRRKLDKKEAKREKKEKKREKKRKKEKESKKKKDKKDKKSSKKKRRRSSSSDSSSSTRSSASDSSFTTFSGSSLS